MSYIYKAAPTNWQPADIQAAYQVTSWSQETVNGVVCIVATCAGNQKIYLPLTQVRSTSGTPKIGTK